jgi:hypothetical protein
VIRRRRSESGIFRGCCIGLVLLLVVIVAAIFVTVRALAAPDLGAPPAGPSHGSSETQIAVAINGQLAAELASNPQAVATLSEQDLSVIANANRPSRFQSLQARIRNGEIAVSGPTSEGPFTVTVVAYVSVSLNTQQSPPQFAANITQLNLGQISMPGFITDILLHNSSPTLEVNTLFSQAALRLLQANVECLRVTSSGVVIAVHRPGVAPDPGVCG